MTTEPTLATVVSLLTDLQRELHELKKQRPIDKTTLWSQTQIAEYLGVSTKHLANHKILTRGDFPRARLVPITDEKPTKRWLATEVIDWAGRIKETQNKKRAA